MKHVDRTGLYIMVFIAMFVSCENSDKLDHLKRDVHDLQDDAPATELVQPAVALPEFCKNEYRYPRSDRQARECFKLLYEQMEEIRE